MGLTPPTRHFLILLLGLGMTFIGVLGLLGHL